eukprot:1139850-Pelagomonas_calceolata.AAC.1
MLATADHAEACGTALRALVPIHMPYLLDRDPSSSFACRAPLSLNLVVGSPAFKEKTPYPFHQHLPAGHLPNPGEPFLHLNAVCLGQQLKQLLYEPPPAAAAAAFPAPPPKQRAAAHAPIAPKVQLNTGAVPATPRNAKQQHNPPLQHAQSQQQPQQ